MPTPENQKKMEYLSRYQKLGKRIEQLSAERDMWFTKAAKNTRDFQMAKEKNGPQSHLGEWEQYTAMGKEITEELQKLRRIRREIRSVIAALEDETLQTLMLYRYINGMTFEEIAVKMDYSWRQVCRKHGEALARIKMS